MRKYVILNKDDALSKEVSSALKASLDRYCVYDVLCPSLVISVGGDGTMLECVHRYHSIDPVFVGVHTGTLGFYTEFLKEDIDQLVACIVAKDYDIMSRFMLDIQVKNNDEITHYYALNEVRIDHGYRTQVFDIHVDGEMLERFRGNGVCVSTPSGSSAYNKALGGAVVFPNLPLMQLTEVASINHNAYRCLGSSLILGQKQSLLFDRFNDTNVSIGIDHKSYQFDDVVGVQVCLSDCLVRFINAHDVSFISRLKKAFIY